MYCVTIDGNIIFTRNFEIIDSTLYSSRIVSNWWFNKKEEAEEFVYDSGLVACWFCAPDCAPIRWHISFIEGRLSTKAQRKFLFVTEAEAKQHLQRYDFAIKRVWEELRCT